MTVNLHEHFTGGQVVIVILCELAWWAMIYFVGRKWWRKHRAKRGT